MNASFRETLEPFLDPTVEIDWTNSDLPVSPIVERTPGLEANCRYFGNLEWASSYFKHCHRNERFRSRWTAACGSWDDQVVVDIGCGPGNLFASLGGRPRLLLGVDISPGTLELARQVGYQTVLADAHRLHFVPAFADIVVMNATLHHCDHMATVLAEAGRLVKPGGLFVSDHDPQRSAWDFRGPAKWAWDFRLKAYLWIKKGFHRSMEEQTVALASEIHHEPGRGVTRALYHETLEPLGFEVALFPHNHDLGREIFDGKIGRADRKYRVAQLLSGVNPNSPKAALSLFCRAVRRSLSPPLPVE